MGREKDGLESMVALYNLNDMRVRAGLCVWRVKVPVYEVICFIKPWVPILDLDLG